MIKPEDIIYQVPALDNLDSNMKTLICTAMELYYLQKLEEYLFNDLMKDDDEN